MKRSKATVAAILLLSVALAFPVVLSAAMPGHTRANVSKYKKICRDSISCLMKAMYREPGGSLKYPFIAPGSASYLDDLGDWDSWLSSVALRQILLDCGTDADKE